MTTVAEHLSRAKDLIHSDLNSLRTATDDMAAAKAKGATQRQIADAVGMSPTWVHQMLTWRTDGYREATPFGRQSRANRQRAKTGQAADQNEQKADQSDGTDQAQAAAAGECAETGKAKADRARTDAESATAEPLQAKAESLRPRDEVGRAEADVQAARARSKDLARPIIQSGARGLLIKMLAMLGSINAGQRDNAARGAEHLRKKLGITWDELIIPANGHDPEGITVSSAEPVA